jgi:DNA-binding NarL/FixJ family response regulator
MKFLIVDDNETFRTYLREFITKETDEFIELDDGLYVNSFYKDFKPDWVLLDIVMKNVNGIKAAENLKNEFPEATFAIVSDYSDDVYRKRAAKLGCAAFISKENLFELVEIIQSKANDKK